MATRRSGSLRRVLSRIGWLLGGTLGSACCPTALESRSTRRCRRRLRGAARSPRGGNVVRSLTSDCARLVAVGGGTRKEADPDANACVDARLNESVERFFDLAPAGRPRDRRARGHAAPRAVGTCGTHHRTGGVDHQVQVDGYLLPLARVRDARRGGREGVSAPSHRCRWSQEDARRRSPACHRSRLPWPEPHAHATALTQSPHATYLSTYLSTQTRAPKLIAMTSSSRLPPGAPSGAGSGFSQIVLPELDL